MLSAVRVTSRRLAAAPVLAAVLGLAGVLGGCGSAGPDELPPPAGPAAAAPPAAPPEGRTVRVAPRGAGLGDVVAAGGRIAVAQARPPRLLLLDRRGRTRARVSLPGPPGTLAVDEATGDVLVPAGRRLLRVAARLGVVTADVPLPAAAGAAAAPPGQPAAVVLPEPGTLVLGGGTAVRTAASPVAVVPADRGRKLVVLAGRARVVELRDGRTGRLLDRADAGLGPARMALRGRWLWVTDVRGDALLVYRVIGDTIELSRRVHLPGGPFAITVDPDRYRIHVALTATSDVAELPAHGRPRALETRPVPRGVRGVAALPGPDGGLVAAGDGVVHLLPLPAAR
jgi:hypothetical protein